MKRMPAWLPAAAVALLVGWTAKAQVPVSQVAPTAGAVQQDPQQAFTPAFEMTMQPEAVKGCALAPMVGTTYDACGGTWFLPSYGANCIYCRVVPAP